jgi:type I restriction enzyme S subunit
LLDWRKQGATVESIEQENLANCLLPLPPLDEQRQMAGYLDRKTAEIDALIQKTRALIDLLREQRAAVVHRTVTKGLAPDVPMKDSGVEWLGEVPEHWAVAPVYARYNVQLGKMLDKRRIDETDKRPYLRNVDVQWDQINVHELPGMTFQGDDLERYRLQRGDLLVCEGGEVGRAAIWDDQLEECYYQKALHRLRPQGEGDEPRFMFYLLYSAANQGLFEATGNPNTIIHLTAEKLRTHRFPFPPYEAQQAIAQHLDHKCRETDLLIDWEGDLVARLLELRASLISEVVTGKIDVRGAALAEPVSTEEIEPTDVKAFLVWVLANYVLNRMASADHFGRITFVKVLFVLQYELKLRFTDKRYSAPWERWDFGPYNPKMVKALEASLQREGYWKKVQTEDKHQVRYEPLENASDPKGYFEKYWGDRREEIDEVVDLFESVTTGKRPAQRAEIVATLYGAWNDLLHERDKPTDDEIVSEARENWHEGKRRIETERWHRALAWMREHEFVPSGFGARVVPREVQV